MNPRTQEPKRESATRAETGDVARAETVDVEWILSLFFPHGATDKQRTQTANAAAPLLAAGCERAWLEAFVRSRPTAPPWHVLDGAVEAWRKHRARRARERRRVEAQAKAEAQGRRDAAAETAAPAPPADPLARRVFDAVGPRQWATWLEGATIRNGSGLTVEVATRFHADYVRAHFGEVLAGLAEGRPVEVVVAAALPCSD